ncbi:MAG TPA: endonuclease/exonuclease/phosphatase family protein [Candidatus Limnocylindrales bacterium]|nr:endonuclease/exonuclease/phosphatase family protein [Candidatus Limnocylindrales bacterium]
MTAAVWPAELRQTRPLRVVSWNIRAAIGPGEPFPPAWWRHVRRERLERVAAFLVSLDPDVVTLQEVTIMNVDGEIHDQPSDLARLTGRHARYGAIHTFPLIEPETRRVVGSASWGNAILSREPLVDGFVTGLPRAADGDLLEPPDADDPQAGVAYRDAEPGHREPRCAVGGRLAGGTGAAGSGPAVVTAHLTYIGRNQREQQASGLAGLAAALDGPLIVSGDFNAPLDAAELAPLAGSFDDAFAAAGLAPGDPRRRTCGPFAIDHVLTRGLSTIDCRVADEAGDASDHWPVVADLVPTPTVPD